MAAWDANYKFFSTRPEKRMGEEAWDSRRGFAKRSQTGLPFGSMRDGAFYGPKLDIMFVDALNDPGSWGLCRWTSISRTFDFYVGRDNRARPVMLHELLGSLERFLGFT